MTAPDALEGRRHPSVGRARAVPGSGPSLLGPLYLLFAVMVGTTVPNALWGEFQDRLGIATTQVTSIFGAYATAVVVTLLVFGAVSDRLGRRPVLLAGSLLAAAASAITLGDSVTTLYLGRVASGVSVGLVSGAAVAYLAELRPGSDAARVALLATGATMAGLAVGPLLGGVLAATGGGSVATPFVAHLVMLAVAFPALRGPETVRVRRGAWRSIQRPVVPAARRSFAGAALAGFTANAQLGLLAALAPTFLIDAIGNSGPLVAGLVGALLFAAAGTGQLTTVNVPARTRLVVGMVAVVVGPLAVLFSLVSGSLLGFIAATAIAGAAGGLGFSGGLASANALADERERGAVSSTWFVATYLGLVGPVIGAGRLIEALGPPAAVAVFGLVTALLAVAATALSRSPAGSVVITPR